MLASSARFVEHDGVADRGDHQDRHHQWLRDEFPDEIPPRFLQARCALTYRSERRAQATTERPSVKAVMFLEIEVHAGDSGV